MLAPNYCSSLEERIVPALERRERGRSGSPFVPWLLTLWILTKLTMVMSKSLTRGCVAHDPIRLLIWADCSIRDKPFFCSLSMQASACTSVNWTVGGSNALNISISWLYPYSNTCYGDWLLFCFLLPSQNIKILQHAPTCSFSMMGEFFILILSGFGETTVFCKRTQSQSHSVNKKTKSSQQSWNMGS